VERSFKGTRDKAKSCNTASQQKLVTANFLPFRLPLFIFDLSDLKAEKHLIHPDRSLFLVVQ